MNPIKSPPTLPEMDDLIIPMAERKTMTTLLPGDCRWPVGDPQAAGFHFCGKPKQADHPYCEFHVRRASTPSRARVVSYNRQDGA